MKRVLSKNPEARTVQVFHSDPVEQKWHIQNVQDVEPIAEAAKATFNTTDERARWGEGMVHVARIPNVIFWELEKKGITKDAKAFTRWLNERDNRVFRTRPGRV